MHLEVDGASFVIDTGPDFRQQMLRENITHLDAVLMTHAHRDHTAGLDDVRAFNFMQNMKIPLYGSEETLKQIQTDFAYVFGPKNYPGLPRIELNTITDSPFNMNGIDIIPLPVMHLKMPVHGFRIGNFSYITDCNHMPDATLELLKGTEVLVLNALQIKPHISHFNLPEAIEMVKKIKPQKAYFTHISHKLGLHGSVEAELPRDMHLAFDGLHLSL